MKISFTDVNVVHKTFQTYSKLRNSPTQIDFRFQYLVEHIKETVIFSSTTLGAATVKPRNIVQGSIYSAVPIVLCLHIVHFGRETQECS